MGNQNNPSFYPEKAQEIFSFIYRNIKEYNYDTAHGPDRDTFVWCSAYLERHLEKKKYLSIKSLLLLPAAYIM